MTPERTLLTFSVLLCQRVEQKAGTVRLWERREAPPGRQVRITDAAFAAQAKAVRIREAKPPRPRTAVKPGIFPHKIFRKLPSKTPLGGCRGNSPGRPFSPTFFRRGKKVGPGWVSQSEKMQNSSKNIANSPAYKAEVPPAGNRLSRAGQSKNTQKTFSNGKRARQSAVHA